MKSNISSSYGKLFLFLFTISFLCSLLLASYIYFNGRLSLDYKVNGFIPSLQDNLFTKIAKVASYVFDTVSMLVVSFFVFIYIWHINYRKRAMLLAFAMLGDAILIYAVKNISHFLRPANALINETSSAFPSGHAMTSVVFFGTLLFFSWNYVKKETKILLLSAYLLIVLFIGFTRVYLNVHWLSDIIGGYLFGISWAIFSVFAINFLWRNSH